MIETPAERGRAAVLALPDRMRIGPFEYRIKKFTPGEAESRGLFGEHSSLEQTIFIRETMPSAIKAVDTLLHEALHAIFWAYNVDDSDKEERTVATLSTGLTALYRDNPWLLEWIGRSLSEPAAAISMDYILKAQRN